MAFLLNLSLAEHIIFITVVELGKYVVQLYIIVCQLPFLYIHVPFMDCFIVIMPRCACMVYGSVCVCVCVCLCLCVRVRVRVRV